MAPSPVVAPFLLTSSSPFLEAIAYSLDLYEYQFCLSPMRGLIRAIHTLRVSFFFVVKLKLGIKKAVYIS